MVAYRRVHGHYPTGQCGIHVRAKLAARIPYKHSPFMPIQAHPLSRKSVWVLCHDEKATNSADDVEAATVEEIENKDTDEAFNWTKTWYPVTTLEALDPSRPNPMMLLGKSFVLWRDGDGEWRCFEDACPHRLAPLSEGRIEESDGTLMCSYHGWRFDGDGECTRIPQSKTPEKCRNQRSKVKGFPVKVTKDLVWVWPDDSPDAFIDASVMEYTGMSVDEGTDTESSPLYMRDVYYPFDIGIESVLDNSHFHFAHCGIRITHDAAGWSTAEWGKRSNLCDLNFSMESTHKDIDGEKKKEKQEIPITAPGSVNYYCPTKGRDDSSTLMMYFTPVSSSRSRFFMQFVANKKYMPGEAQSTEKSSPPWKEHLTHNATLDSNMFLLNKQARNLRATEASGETWTSKYCIPVSGFRSWLHGKIGDGGPKLPSGEPLLVNTFDDVTRETMLNRYDSHTKYCKSCSSVLAQTMMMKKFSLGLCCACLAYGLFAAKGLMKSSGSSILTLVCMVMGSVLSGYAAKRLGDFETNFVYRKFEPSKL